MTTYTEQQESEIVELFMLNEDDRDERLKAHYRQGKIVDGKWVNDEEEEEDEWCGCLGEEGSGVCDDCDETNYDAELMEKVNVKENPVEPPPMVWDGDVKQTIVEVKCGSCKTVYKDRQCRNDCVSAYPYEYPKKGFYWMENKECFNCYKSRV